jgi:eukaryotic-like serine/threonine-protein kinase
MELSTSGKKVARFGLYEADLRQRVLTRGGLRVKLQDQPFQVLALLLETPGEVVSREDIRQKLWSADTYVEFDDGLNTAIKKLRLALNDSADNPRFVETVPRRGYRFMAPVTFAAISEAGGSDGASATQTESLVVTATEQSKIVIEKSEPRSRLMVGAIILFLVLAAGAGGYFYRAAHRTAPSRSEPITSASIPTTRPRPSVAVMGFRNLSRGSEEDWLSTALSEMLNTELAAGERLRMVPGEQISRAKVDLSLVDAEALAKETLLRLRSGVGADYVVLGSYTALGQNGKRRIRLDLRLQDARAGETVAEEAVSGGEEDLFDLVAEAGTRLRQRLDLGALASEEAVRVRASLPSNAEAARWYAEGLTKLRTFDASAARDLLTKAVNADPRNAMIHAALATAWSQLGYDVKSQQEAKQAFDLSVSLSREDHLVVEGRYRQAIHEWQKAVEIYRNLWNLFPDNLDYGLQLASSQTSAGVAKEALSTIAALRKRSEPAQPDPRIDMAEAFAEGSLSDFRHSEEAAASAAKAGEALHSRLLVASALREEGEEWERLGQFENSRDALQRAEALYAEAGDRGGAALTRMLIGELLSDHGDLTGARKAYTESLATCREIGHLKCAAYSLNDLGNLDRDQNDLAAAKTCYQEVLALHTKTGNRAGVGVALSNLGNVADDLGDLAGAQSMRKQAIDIFTELGDQEGIGSQQTNLAAVLAEEGDLVTALELVDRSIASHRRISAIRGLSFALTSRADILEQQDRLQEARKAQAEALEIRQKLNTPEFLAMSGTQSASLSLDQNLFSDAEAAANQAAKQIENLKAFDLEATAYSLLARSLLKQGKLSDARKAADHAMASSRQVAAHPPRFDAMLAVAAVEAASGKVAEARKDLSTLLAESTRFGYIYYQFEARLAVCEIDLKSSNAVAARTRLAALEKDARARGFNLIARRAAAAGG